ncbi:MAG: apolipoprotein N-acyltransferase, partial [Gemmatimonadetes bacterium]|nr:apolipoprotein N-acyltransferase [Gemmatimonadota bacterium]
MTSRPRLFPAQTLGAGLATGLLLALGYAPIGWSPVAFVAFAPLLLALESLADEARAGRPAKARAFGAGWAAGLVLYVWLLWWIVVLDSPTLTIPWVRWLAPFLIAAFMALYWGLASLAYVFVRARTRAPAYVIAPAAFTVMELVRGRGELGFPWGEIGYTQVAFLPSLQFAAVAGVSGVGFWVVATGALVALAARERRGRWIFLAALLALGPTLWGAYRLASATDRGPSIRVALVQPNVRNDEKWLPENREAIFEELAELSREGVRQGAEIVLWPETAAPCYLLKDGRWLPWVQALADSLDVPMFLGTTDYEIVQEGNERWVTYSNAGVLFDRRGDLTGRMDKIRLVPFGEYVPFSRWIPLLRKVDFGEA